MKEIIQNELAVMAAIKDGTFDSDFRQQSHDYHASYFAGQTSRYLPMPPGIKPQGSGADYHFTQREYFLAVERFRQFDRDNIVIGKACDRLTKSVFQQGFAFSPNTGDKILDQDIKDKFCGHEDSWANDPNQCDYEGEKPLNKIAELSFRDILVAGDAFHLLTNQQKIQTFENHHCRNPFGVDNTRSANRSLTGIVNGVQLKNGRRVAYHMTPQTVGAHGRERYDTKALPARDAYGNRQVLHVYDPKRFTQRRGMGVFAPAVFPAQYHDDLQFAALVNAKRQSFIAIIRELDVNAKLGGGSGGQKGTRTEHLRSDGSRQINEGGGPGQEYNSRQPGESIKAWSPTIPHNSFFPHTELLLTFMSIMTDVPLMCLMLDASKGNFNSYRGVIGTARESYRNFQRDRKQQFHCEVYKWWLRQEMRKEPAWRAAAERSDIRIFGHRFQPQGWSYLQPVHDATADDIRESRNQASKKRIMEERGYDYESEIGDIIGCRKQFLKDAMEAADELLKTHPKADWQDVFSRMCGGQSETKISLTGDVGDQQQPTDNQNDDSTTR